MSKAQEEINEYFKDAVELGESDYIVVGTQYSEDDTKARDEWYQAEVKAQMEAPKKKWWQR
ncbi:MAG TPA: hypothetical protein VL020_04960 [Pseudomonadales bacterium]|nr:hypothetical protein [Pseudomonadales bacterium]